MSNNKQKKLKREKEILDALLKTHEAIKLISPKEANSLVFLPKMFVKTTIPIRKVSTKDSSEGYGLFFERRDGKRVFRLSDASGKGLPYGVIPRLLLPLINRQVVLNNSREITIAESMSSLLKNLGYGRTGGKKGTITELKRQIECLLRCTYWYGNVDQEIKGEQLFKIPNGYLDNFSSLFESPRKKTDDSKLILDEHYFKLVMENRIPLDFRVLLALKFSPLAMDIYCWITYKSFNGKGIKSSPIGDYSLMQQFGCNYKESKEFKRHFKNAFKYVNILYPAAEIKFLTGRIKVVSTVPHVHPIHNF